MTPYFGRKKGGLYLMSWSRCVMGLRSSPHGCVKMHTLGEEVVRGDQSDRKNPFFFDSVRLNLPGSSNYDPTIPRVSKLRTDTGLIANDMVSYVDDKRLVASLKTECRWLCHRVGARLCYLGEQDALRKRSELSQRAGAWAGLVVHTDDGKITVMCTREKWVKAQGYIRQMYNILKESQGIYDYKTLEQQRGFLVYVSRTYPVMVPYLKGIHLTLDSWRPNRDQEGWKLQGNLPLDGEDEVHQALLPHDHPPTVSAVPRLTLDLEALLCLMHSDTPPKRMVRSKRACTVLYGFGDASGTGFGSTVFTMGETHYRYGIWGDDLHGLSSNF
jgi:hypothetical protein